MNNINKSKFYLAIALVLLGLGLTGCTSHYEPGEREQLVGRCIGVLSPQQKCENDALFFPGHRTNDEFAQQLLPLEQRESMLRTEREDNQ